MDRLHPLVPIQPASPVPPDYTRVQRIQRDQQRDSEPDWHSGEDEDADEQHRDEQFEDDYDPNWSDTAAAETYNDHGELTDNPVAGEHASEAERPWNPSPEGERRAAPRSVDDDEGQEPGPHIDIIA